MKESEVKHGDIRVCAPTTAPAPATPRAPWDERRGNGTNDDRAASGEAPDGMTKTEIDYEME